VSAAFSNPTEIFGSPSDRLRRRLEAPGFIAWLSSIVRRRVPSSDVDDVVQAVLCDALASHLIPSDDREITRWICGIAKNKAADFHRRAKRENESHEEIAIGARSGEMRVMLRSVVADASARNHEALEWIVREHDGEELASIAEELAIPAPVVRQRVSRLRRALRERWLGGGVLVLALAVTCAGYEKWNSSSHEAIAPDTAGSPLAAAFLTEANGEWRVTEDDTTPELAKGALVHINGALLTVVVAGVAHERLIAIDAIHGNTIEAEISGNGERRHVLAMLAKGELTIQEGTRTIRLVRP
jgi:DNA-directed RNA polymerase specialized sigma24 family protein